MEESWERVAMDAFVQIQDTEDVRIILGGYLEAFSDEPVSVAYSFTYSFAFSFDNVLYILCRLGTIYLAAIGILACQV